MYEATNNDTKSKIEKKRNEDEMRKQRWLSRVDFDIARGNSNGEAYSRNDER